MPFARVLALGGWLLGASAVAQPGPLESVSIRWDGPVSCPDDGRVRADALALLAAEAKQEPVTLVLRVTEVGDHFRLHLTGTSTTRTVERTVDIASCAEARQTGALLAALTINPNAALVPAPETPEATDAPPAPEAESPPAPPAQPTQTQVAPPDATADGAVEPQPPAPALPWLAEVHLQALGDVAVLPGPSLGPGLALRLRRAPWVLGATGGYLPPRTDSVEGHPTASVRTHLWMLGARGCYEVPRGSFSVAGCFGAEAGRLSAESSGVSHERADHSLWLGLGGDVAGSLDLSNALAVELSIGALLPLRRSVLAFDDLGAAHTVPTIAMRLSLGLTWRFAKRPR